MTTCRYTILGQLSLAIPPWVKSSLDKWFHQWRRQAWAKRGLSPKISLSPHHETHWSRIGSTVQNSQILIVSAVKICKQCLQTASASSPPTGASPLDPTGDFRLPFPWAKAPKCSVLLYIIDTFISSGTQLKPSFYIVLCATQRSADS